MKNFFSSIVDCRRSVYHRSRLACRVRGQHLHDSDAKPAELAHILDGAQFFQRYRLRSCRHRHYFSAVA